MHPVYIILIVLASILLSMFLSFTYTCYACLFKASRPKKEEQYPTPPGKEYDEFRDEMVEWIKETDKLPSKEYEIISYDGLKLKAKYFEYSKDAPIEILVHGYRGTGRRDMSGGISRSFAVGHSALLIDQRGSGNSEGKAVTFGIKEKYDVRAWIDFVIKEINKDAKIILTGMSMGAATVLMCSALELPENVIGIIADCGYSTNEGISKIVIRSLHLPPKIVYPCVRIASKVLAGFNIDEDSPVEALKKTNIPVIFFHGDSDALVPHTMGEENYNACASSKKRFVLIEGADHGLAYPVNKELYIKELKEFFAE